VKEQYILDGWITLFSVFDQKGVWKGDRNPGWKWPRMHLDNVPSGIVSVPVTMVQYYNERNATTSPMTLFAGHMGETVRGENDTMLEPYIGYALADNTINN